MEWDHSAEDIYGGYTLDFPWLPFTFRRENKFLFRFRKQVNDLGASIPNCLSQVFTVEALNTSDMG